jgi:hypothetical protein
LQEFRIVSKANEGETMKRFMSLIVLIALGLLSLNALTVTVGSVWEGVYNFPIHTVFAYNYTQQIYTQSQINQQGQISKIRFYHDVAGSMVNSHDWVIYMGHVARSSFASTTDWEPAADLTQVFSGSVLSNFPPDGQWMEIILDTPFNYNNTDNLVVAVYENTPMWGETVIWGGFTSGDAMGLYYYDDMTDPDVNNPPPAIGMNAQIAAIQLVFPDTEAPLAPELLYPDHNTSIMNGESLQWTLTGGSADATGYDVYIDGTMVSNNQSSTQYTVSNLAPGAHTWHVVARNNIGTSPPSVTRTFNIIPGVVIGNGTLNSMMPITALYNYNYTQAIYLQPEINISNQRIESIAYYWNGMAPANNSKDWVVYMGHVQRSQFAHDEDWVPVGEMVQVFDGQLNLTDQPGWIEILLDNPFVYNNTDNLVIAVDENTPYCDGNEQFFYSTSSGDQNRGLRYFDDAFNPDPNLPPSGTPVAAFPNIKLQFGDLPTSPILRLSPAALDFGTVQYGQPNPPINVLASNIGSGILNLSAADFSLIGPNAAEFSFDTTNLPAALAPGQNVQIPVSVVGLTPGEITATLRAVYAGVNYDVALTANVLPAGTIVIGDGTDMQRQPFGAVWGYERSAALYTVEQIGIVGTLHMVAWDCASTSESEIPYKIWAKNTTATTLSAETWQSFIADATMLKQGNFTPNTMGWQTFQLDTPFAYTGANLIIAVESNYGGYGGGWGHNFRFTDIGYNRHQEWFQDGGEPTEPGMVNPCIPNIMMHLTSDIEDDLGAISISGNPTPTAGQEASYTVRIRNNGSNNQSNYQVKLMGPDNAQLAVVNGPPINSGMTADVELLWTPTTAGQFSIYGKVEMAGDEIAQNNQTGMLELNVQPEGVQGVTIGEGNEQARFPMDFWMRTSIYETLYMTDELGFNTGTITSMALYNNFDVPVFNAATQIYLGSTSQTDLSAGFIPASQLTLVFDGNVDFPTGENTVIINFQTPYMHTTGNLVMMVVRPMDATWYSFSDYFKCQSTGINRARYDHDDNVVFDPLNPPEGNITAQFPKVTFFYSSQLIQNDLGALGISGDLTPTAGQETNYTVTVKNNGIQNQSTYTVKLMGPDDTVLASVPGPALDSMQTAEVAIPWTPAAEGEMSIFGKVELAGDEIPTNNQTAPLVINVQPAGMSAVTVGTGTQNARIPMDFWYRNSLYETLYLADELGFNTGTITSLAFYNQFTAAVSNSATKIFMGSTDQADLSNGFIPASQLTLVYDGNVDYPAGANTILYNLQTPYVHTGGNLVVMVNRPMDTTWHSSTNYFKCQTIGDNRARNSYDDNSTLDPLNPPAGTLTGQFPQATFFYSPQLIENDLGALSITGNTTPTVGIASTYTVRIKNNGTQAQDTYQVKLMGPEETVLVSVAGPAINSQQTLDVEIPWTPTTAGNYAIYGKVELTGDEISTNNRTNTLNLMVNPAGVQSFTVGDGSQNARLPVDMFWNNSLFETLYFPAEMNGFIGQITGLRFYNNFVTNLPNVPISIWLGTTTQTSLEDGYIPSTQLTLVYDGPVNFPSGENTISINFSEPYMYLDGGNLVMMVYKTAAQWYSSADNFKCQTVGDNRSRNIVADSDNFDPANPPTGTLSGQFPQTTFVVIPGGVGDISGTVTGANNQPLSGVAVSLNDGAYSTTTNDQGQYQLINVLPDTYTMSFTAHGYYEHTQTVVLEEDDDLTINVTMQLLPQVIVSGTVLASDTGLGISGASIRLRGYEPYNANTNAAGVFTIPNVFADHTYDYTISANGYSSANGQIIVGSTNYNMGSITLNEVAYAPAEVTAELDDIGTTALISWLPPDPSALEVVEGFEAETFPPEGWTRTITNDGPPNALGIYPTWCRVGALTISGDLVTPTEGSFQAGLHWDYDHQDEWLITPAFNCPPGAYLRFDGYVFLGSNEGDHYYVKVSTDNGTNWTVLWDASAQTGGWNEYSSPITVDLSAYSGNQLMIAFQALGPADNTGLRYYWFIDNLYIGNSTNSVRFDLRDMTILSAVFPSQQSGETTPVRALSRHREEGGMRSEPRLPRRSEVPHGRSATRVLTGYMVYRLQTDQEQNEDVWTALTDTPITELNLSDPAWETLPNGYYRWAVKAIYTNNVTSVASFSNIMHKFAQTGMIAGTVRRKNTTAIVGATVTNGTVTATTNSQGAYILTVPVGYHSVTASAAGFDSLTVDDVLVNYNLTTTVNFILEPTPNDEYEIPVVATALNGNYPNPFNPETTISYSVKEAGKVKMEVYNIKGQLVRTLVDEEQATGHYKLIFNAKDDRGRSISSGVYLLRMQAPGYHKTSKMILMQ